MEKEPEYRISFSERLSILIKCNELTNAEVARAINVSPGLITKYLSAKASPSYENLIQLADFFSVSMDFLRGNHFSINKTANKRNTINAWIDLLETMNLEEADKHKFLECLRILINDSK